MQESHAQESFEYLLAKFNTKATAAKQAAAADSAREAAGALAASGSAAAAAAAAMPPVSLPFAAQQPGSAAPTASGASAADQMQLPCMQPSYMLYPPMGQQLQLGGYPVALLGGLPAMQALGASQRGSPGVRPAAQFVTADLHAAALMSCGYPAAALLPHSAAMLLHGAGTPTADCLSLMQPSLLFGSPAAGGALQQMMAAAAPAFQPQPPAGSAGASSSQQDSTPKKRKASGAAGAGAGTPGTASERAKVAPPAVVCDKVVAGDQQVMPP